MRIIVSGMLAGDPGQGGATWAVLQYVLGLQRLGHDVWVAEPVAALTARATRYFLDVSAEFGLDGRAALVDTSARQAAGAPYRAVEQACRGADVHLNFAGMLADERLAGRIPARVYLDLDPGFTQLWASEGIDMRLDGHTHFVTVGLAVGSPDCPVPSLGRSWQPTLPPVVLGRWPVAEQIRCAGFTSVGNWRSYGTLHAGGVRYGQRAHAVRDIIDLPTRTREPIMPAFDIHAAEVDDLRALAEGGWQLLDPGEVAATPALYHGFVQGSKAEIGVPKEGYLVGRTGWFSDRSACYLASGRPVLLGDTGFAAHMPTGAGLLAYTSLDEAVAGIEAVNADYGRHRRAARELAEDVLDSDKVLTKLLACL